MFNAVVHLTELQIPSSVSSLQSMGLTRINLCATNSRLCTLPGSAESKVCRLATQRQIINLKNVTKYFATKLINLNFKRDGYMSTLNSKEYLHPFGPDFCFAYYCIKTCRFKYIKLIFLADSFFLKLGRSCYCKNTN